MNPIIRQGAILMEHSQLAMEELVVYKEIAESAEQRAAEESRNRRDRLVSSKRKV
jgi:hypothetical protein